jgi:hypothetical protein
LNSRCAAGVEQQQRELIMKKVLLAVLMSAALGGSAFAQWDHDGDRRDDDRRDNGGRFEHGGYRIEREVDHLNRMLQHVRWEAQNYHAGWRTRSEINSVSARVNEVNARFRSGRVNPGWLHGRIESLHNELHSIEMRLHSRPEHFYRWQ